jgi:hypothetical protein
MLARKLLRLELMAMISTGIVTDPVEIWAWASSATENRHEKPEKNEDGDALFHRTASS